VSYYRRYNRSYSKPTARDITVKFSGHCASCGGIIKAGSIATYYPVGTPTAKAVGGACIAHIGGLDGNSQRCAAILREKYLEDAATNDYAGDGLDARYEDDCARACGL
jgi:hypothetical protein